MLSARSRRAVRAGMSSRALSRGAGLIEVLVAILIASLGLLAFAGITATSVRYTKMAQYRATATQLAADIAERARANVVDGIVDAYEVKSRFEDQVAVPAMPGKTCHVVADTCSAAEIAAVDLVEWRQTVRNQLPEGSVFLQKDPSVDVKGTFDLWIAWRDPALDVGEDPKTGGAAECPISLSVAMQTGVRCVYFRVKL